MFTVLRAYNIDISECNILDLGGGIGRLAFPLSTLCKKVILCEPSVEMLEIAKSNAQKVVHGTVEYRQEGFLELSLAPNSIDVIISINDPFMYLIKLKTQLKALENVYKILRPGGILIFEMMNFFSLLKNYRHPKAYSWEEGGKQYFRTVTHRVRPFMEIWEHTENIFIKDLTNGKIEHITSVHELKMISPNEMRLLLHHTKFDEIKINPKVEFDWDNETRLWAFARKPRKNKGKEKKIGYF
ncbi:MAG: methyltransferase domain-containing protein [Candidatus Heimdallarchaeaceae archaeon]